MNPSNNTNTVGTVKLANAAGGFAVANKTLEKKVEPTNPFVRFGYILLILSIMISLGLLLYDNYLKKFEAATLKTILEKRNKVAGMPLTEMHELLNQLSSVNAVASKHVYSTAMLRFLEVITNKNLYWKAFTMRQGEKGKIFVDLQGVSPNYYYIIQQMDEFKDPKYSDYIADPVLSGISLVKKTETKPSFVNFSVSFMIKSPYTDKDSDTYLNNAVTGNKIATSSNTIIINSTNTNAMPINNVPADNNSKFIDEEIINTRP